MKKIIDLHTHSTASDGTATPSEIIDLAVDKGLSAVALTDHDTVAGVEVALRASEGTGLELVPGVEISTVIESREVHLLGYFIDPESSRMQEAFAVLRSSRLERARTLARDGEAKRTPVAGYCGWSSSGSPALLSGVGDRYPGGMDFCPGKRRLPGCASLQ